MNGNDIFEENKEYKNTPAESPYSPPNLNKMYKYKNKNKKNKYKYSKKSWEKQYGTFYKKN